MSSRSLLVAAAVAYAITLGLWVVIASADVEVDPDGFIIEPIARMPFTAFAMSFRGQFHCTRVGMHWSSSIALSSAHGRCLPSSSLSRRPMPS